MNKRAGETLRIVAGLYLAYLGGSLILDLIKGKPDNMAYMLLFGVLFIAVGGFVAIQAIKNSFARLKAERDEAAEEESEAEWIEETVEEELEKEENEADAAAEVAETREEIEAEDDAENTVQEAEAAEMEIDSTPENSKIASDLKELKAFESGVEVIEVLKEKEEE